MPWNRAAASGRSSGDPPHQPPMEDGNDGWFGPREEELHARQHREDVVAFRPSGAGNRNVGSISLAPVGQLRGGPLFEITVGRIVELTY